MKGWYATGFLLLAALDTTAHLGFKLAAMHAAPLEPSVGWALRAAGEPWLYAAMACYVATFFTWMTLLRTAPVGPAFAASHLEVVTVLAASALFLHEAVSPRQLVGAALIVTGIGCLALAGARNPAPAATANAN